MLGFLGPYSFAHRAPLQHLCTQSTSATPAHRAPLQHLHTEHLCNTSAHRAPLQHPCSSQALLHMDPAGALPHDYSMQSSTTKGKNKKHTPLEPTPPPHSTHMLRCHAARPPPSTHALHRYAVPPVFSLRMRRITMQRPLYSPCACAAPLRSAPCAPALCATGGPSRSSRRLTCAWVPEGPTA